MGPVTGIQGDKDGSCLQDSKLKEEMGNPIGKKKTAGFPFFKSMPFHGHGQSVGPLAELPEG
jgi:hypothetical protein